ncbi:MAG TPA: FAD-binding oxidoreductase [Dermatophilaceae bacterium]|nr:FAD-binding oxidoreductase [Dermatophilaceae bacterium]
MPLLSRPAAAHPRFHALEVAAVDPVAEHAVAVAFAVPDALAAVLLDYLPGQYVTLRADIGRDVVRQSYSLWTPPSRARRERLLRVAAARVQGGRMSPWLTEAVAPGDHVDVLPPLGDFVLTPAAGPRHHVAVAGGSGITPVLAIIAAALEEHPGSRVDLLLTNRTRASTVLAAEVATLVGASGGRLGVTHVLTREESPGALSGHVTGERIAAVAGDVGSVDAWWLCGPEGLLALTEAELAARGVPEGRVHRERFTATGPVDAQRPPAASGAGPAQRS